MLPLINFTDFSTKISATHIFRFIPAKKHPGKDTAARHAVLRKNTRHSDTSKHRETAKQAVEYSFFPPAAKSTRHFVKNTSHVFQNIRHLFQNICLVFFRNCTHLKNKNLQNAENNPFQSKHCIFIRSHTPPRKHSLPLHILPAPKKYLQMLFTSKLRINQAFCAKYGRFSKKNFAILINRFNFAA